jgi:NitT/TauT family transport system permease protein
MTQAENVVSRSSADGVRTSLWRYGMNGPRSMLLALLKGAVLPLLFAAFWETGVRSGSLVAGVIPAPSKVVSSWYIWVFGNSTPRLLELYNGTWLHNTTDSVVRVSEGFAVATVIGVPLGLLLGWSRELSRYADPTIQLIRPIPITAWVPFSIAIFGIYEQSAIFLISLGAFFPILLNTMGGVRETQINHLRAATMLGANRLEIILRVVFPSALPAIFLGLRIAIGISWMVVIVAEMVAVKSGLGYVLWDAYYIGRLDIVVAAMISVGVMGFLSDRVISFVGYRVLRWKRLVAHA